MSEGLNPIPVEIIEAWAKGEYQLGDIPSLAYSQLGTALFLRSWYVYENATGEKKLSGVAKIDIKGAFLFLGGIRLLDGDEPTAVFWTSEVSHFASAEEIIWFYLVFKPDDPNVQALARTRIPQRGAADPTADAPARFGLSQADWHGLLDYLRSSFDSDMERLRASAVPAASDRGMLRFAITPDLNTHLCTYYQFYSHEAKTELIHGTSRFWKVTK